MQDKIIVTPIGRWLSRQPEIVFVLYTMFAAFAAYASMYAFRKPFTATGYEGISAFTCFGVTFGYKVIAVISQLLGYMTSKFIGIKVASEATMKRRVPLVLGLILFAELMLLFFGLVPAPYNLVFLFMNGLPLGMVWSLLFGIVEGRKVTEFLALAMSVSVIFAEGIVRGVGRWTIDTLHVSEFRMPFVTGLLFIPILLLSLFMLYQVPHPTEEDIANRTARKPMSREDRRSFIRTYFPGVCLLIFGYLVLMVYRDLRGSFMDLILKDLGHKADASTFGGIEIKVGICVTACLALTWKIKSHRMAVIVNFALISAGAILQGLSTILLYRGVLSPETFYLLNGIGLYISYVIYQAILPERLLASLHTVATASFIIALADSYGYLSTVSLYLTKDIASQALGITIKWKEMLHIASYVVMVAVPLTCAAMYAYFRPRLKS